MRTMLFLLQKANCLTDFPSSAHSTPNTQGPQSEASWLPEDLQLNCVEVT